MVNPLKSGRQVVALAGMFMLFILGMFRAAEVGASIAAIAMAVCGANAWEKRGKQDGIEQNKNS